MGQPRDDYYYDNEKNYEYSKFIFISWRVFEEQRNYIVLV